MSEFLFEMDTPLSSKKTLSRAVTAAVIVLVTGCATLDQDPRAPKPPSAVSAASPTQPAQAMPASADKSSDSDTPWYKRLFGDSAKSSAEATKTPDIAKPEQKSTPPQPAPAVAQNVPPNAPPQSVPPPPPIANPSIRPGPPSAEAPAGPTSTAVRTDTAKLYPGTGQFVKPTPLVPAAPQQGDINLNFVAQDLRSIIDFIMRDVLGESFTVHPSVQGNTTIVTAKPIPKSALIPTLETLLRQSNFAMVKEDNIWKILPVANAVRGTTTPQLLPPGVTLKPGYNTILVPLKYLGVGEAQKILQPFALDPAGIQADQLRNMLILSGTQRELKHLTDTIDMFDIDWMKGMSVGVFSLRSTDVKTLQPEINQLFSATGPLAGVVRLVPLERLNGYLMITTQPEYLTRAREWLEKLDSVSGTAGGQRLFVYAVQNGKAENLAQLLGDIFGAKTSGAQAPQVAPGLRPAELRPSITPTPLPGQIAPPQAQPITQPGIAGGNNANSGSIAGVSKELRVIADKDNNALLILASPSEYEVIESALRKLDVMPRQVLIDVTIAEVTLDNALKFGVDWFLQNNGLPGRPNLGGIAGLNTGNGLSVTQTNGVYSPTANSPLGTGLQVLGYVNGGLRAVISAIDTGNNVKLLSNPTIVTSDNKAASLEVGQSISINTGSTTGNGGGTTSSNQYVSTGTIINITPRVNAGGMISLEIDAEVSGPASNDPNPPIDRKRIKNSVTVQSEESIVVAGLIRENKLMSNRGIPLLTRIPIVGGVFGTQGYNVTRSELLISITPRLIANVEQNRQTVEELRKRFQEVGPLIPIGKTQRDLNEAEKRERVNNSFFRNLKVERLSDSQQPVPTPVAPVTTNMPEKK